ncbi:tripartite tricarboxylate transporter substrate binding protein [Xylophilus rhododendri]|uniref:Tripartite tricarboxylate transporter substrate binding protein n=1 Tax=Xylophilus rhododendri TaxID=2697032 RepID=A0A857J3E8_9BURK|nr:tripartite tricarboxylate transporter substrate binding protein [Xylophilus rhododendri]QHI97659.1 tripartite tricarboxylate transporter substrate binding protein [Xylophilus rhododendri]
MAPCAQPRLLRYFPALRRKLLAASALLLLSAGHASAADEAANYPSRPVRVVVAFSAGGGADVVARLVFTRVSARLGQSFVIDNRGGAGGIVGTDAVAKAAPDGYTLLLGQTGPNALNPALFARIPYDAAADFAGVIQLTAYPYVIAVHPTSPLKSLRDLVDKARAEPDTVGFGTAGTGSSAQLAAELFMRTTGTRLVHVPYKGAGPALLDTAAGVTPVAFGDIAGGTPLVTAGRLRGLAVTGFKRTALLPNVPTIAEAGYPGAEALAWHGVYAPARTPPAIVAKLNATVAAVLAEPAVRERLQQDGLETVGGSPAAFDAYTRAEIRKWGDIVRAAGIRIDQ